MSTISKNVFKWIIPVMMATALISFPVSADKKHHKKYPSYQTQPYKYHGYHNGYYTPPRRHHGYPRNYYPRLRPGSTFGYPYKNPYRSIYSTPRIGGSIYLRY